MNANADENIYSGLESFLLKPMQNTIKYKVYFGFSMI